MDVIAHDETVLYHCAKGGYERNILDGKLWCWLHFFFSLYSPPVFILYFIPLAFIHLKRGFL